MRRIISFLGAALFIVTIMALDSMTAAEAATWGLGGVLVGGILVLAGASGYGSKQ